MRKQLLVFGFILGISTLLILACKENEPECYDAMMEAAHTGICTRDCPQVCGCDGITYCNECVANSMGISIISNEPCQ